jgi:hypothetical protein
MRKQDEIDMPVPEPNPRDDELLPASTDTDTKRPEGDWSQEPGDVPTGGGAAEVATATTPPLGVESDAYVDAVANAPTPGRFKPNQPPPQIRPVSAGMRPFRSGSFAESRIQGFSGGPGAALVAGGDDGIDDAIRRGLRKSRMS